MIIKKLLWGGGAHKLDMISDYLGGWEILEGKEYLTAINFDEFTTVGYNLTSEFPLYNSELLYQVCNDCVSLTSLHIPQSFEIIPQNMFSGCTSLSSVTIDEGVTQIRSNAFNLCTSLSSITLPNSLKRVFGAFIECWSLTSITFPTNVEQIDYEELWGCSNLKTVTFKSKNVVYSQITYLTNEECNLETLYVQPNLLEKYRNNEDWKPIADKIKPLEE